MSCEKPIFQQIMEMIEDDIISGTYQVNDIIISTTQISKLLSVNPTTSVKAVSNLAEEGVLYKKRGIGMCVAQGARDKILARRKKMFFEEAVPELLMEANKLGISETELIQTIRKENEQYD